MTSPIALENDLQEIWISKRENRPSNRSLIASCDSKGEVLRIVKESPSCVRYAKQQFLKDPDIILQAGKASSYRVFRAADPILKSDPDFVLKVLDVALEFKNISALSIINEDMRKDRRFVMSVLDRIEGVWEKGSRLVRQEQCEIDDQIFWLIHHFSDDKQVVYRLIDKFFHYLPNSFSIDHYRFCATIYNSRCKKFTGRGDEGFDYGQPVLSEDFLKDGDLVYLLFTKNHQIIRYVKREGVVAALLGQKCFAKEIYGAIKDHRPSDSRTIFFDWQTRLYGERLNEIRKAKNFLSINFDFDTL